MITFKQVSLFLVLVVLAIITKTSSVLASGFSVNEITGPTLDNASLGNPASAEDASTIFSNPAGLTRLKGSFFTGGGYFIFPSFRFQNQGSSSLGIPLTGGNGGNGGVDIFSPNIYVALPLNDRVKMGIAINVPYGLATSYDPNWVGRYHAIESQLKTININPALAVKLNNNISVGVGVDLQYAQADLSNAIDFGLIGFSVGLPTRPQSADGLVKFSGSDWSWGYNLGVLYEPSQNTRIGLTYRSQITHNIRGNTNFTVPDAVAPLTATGLFKNTSATSVVPIPETVTLGVYQQVNPRLAATADISWTGWDRFQELRLKFNNPAQPDVVEPQKWHNTLTYSVGANYHVSKNWKIRAGVSYDPSPIDDAYRTPRIPDSDRVWLSLGTSLKASNSVSVDVGYSHIFFTSAPINLPSQTSGNLQGQFSNSVDVVGVDVKWKL